MRLNWRAVKQKYYPLILGFCFLHVLMAGGRLPNIWSATHYLFDYRLGFIKRGLAGSILSFLAGDSISYFTIAAVAGVVFVTTLFVWWVYTREFIIPENLSLLAAFLLSPGMVFFVHEVGYLDHLGLLILFLCLFLPVNWMGLLGMFAGSSVAILCHEAYFLIWFPILVLKLVLHLTLVRDRPLLVGVLVLIVAVTGLTDFVGSRQMSYEQGQRYTEHIKEKAGDFRIRDDAVSVLYRGGTWDLVQKWPFVDSGRFFTGAIMMLPLPIFLIYLSINSVRNTVENTVGIYPAILIYGMIPVASLSPLAVNLFGGDLWRFFALSQLSSFIVLLIIQKYHENDNFFSVSRPGFSLRIIAIGLIVLGSVTQIPLYDGYEVRWPPYSNVWRHLEAVYDGKEPLFPIPNP